MPTGGLAFFFAPPSGAWDALIGNPFRTVFYAACVLSASAVLGKSWIGLAGAGPREVARQLRDQGLAILTLRESAGAAHLGRHIPLAATFGAVAVTAIAIFGDAFGVIGGGACEKSPGRPVVRVQRSKALLFFAAVVIGVTIIFDVFERVTRDLQSEGGFQGLMEQGDSWRDCVYYCCFFAMACHSLCFSFQRRQWLARLDHDSMPA